MQGVLCSSPGSQISIEVLVSPVSAPHPPRWIQLHGAQSASSGAEPPPSPLPPHRPEVLLGLPCARTRVLAPRRPEAQPRAPRRVSLCVSVPYSGFSTC